MCSFLDEHGSFACEVKYLHVTAIVYDRFNLTIGRVKRCFENIFSIAGEAIVSAKEATPFAITVLVVWNLCTDIDCSTSLFCVLS